MTEILSIYVGFLLAWFVSWRLNENPDKDYYDDYNLYHWLERNNYELYQKCLRAYPPDEMRIILNEATGLQILSTDLVQKAKACNPRSQAALASLRWSAPATSASSCQKRAL